MHRSGMTFSYACVCGHALVLHLCNWMEDVSMHSLDVRNINVCQLYSVSAFLCILNEKHLAVHNPCAQKCDACLHFL